VAAEETVQLPPRDTRNIKKTEEKEQKDFARARELRSTRGESRESQDPKGASDGTN
jgi:membrane protein